MPRSRIEWAESTWNPLTGCAKISPGCKHCYAERMAKRLQAMGQPKDKDEFRRMKCGYPLEREPALSEVEGWVVGVAGSVQEGEGPFLFQAVGMSPEEEGGEVVGWSDVG